MVAAGYRRPSPPFGFDQDLRGDEDEGERMECNANEMKSCQLSGCQ